MFCIYTEVMAQDETATFEYQSTESTDADGCIQACKSSNREIFSLIPFVQPAI